MATTLLKLHKNTVLFLVLFISSTLIPTTLAKKCGSRSEKGTCHNRHKALKLKIVAICSILVTSTIGVCLPLFSRSVPTLKPDRNMFVVVKAFASGVILATGYMHVMPDSFDDLRSKCLPKRPWRKFPFTTFVAMLSAVLVLMVDAILLNRYGKQGVGLNVGDGGKVGNGGGNGLVEFSGNGHIHGLNNEVDESCDEKDLMALMKHRVVAQVLELGIVVHSVVIGLSTGASDNQCTIRPLIAALCFHQLFEGMGLGGCILQAEYDRKTKGIMVLFFAATTPFGIVLGIGLSNVYREDSPTALIVVGLLNAASAGLLNYMALVDLLAADFMGPKLQSSLKLLLCAFAAVLLGAGGMSVMAIWA